MSGEAERLSNGLRANRRKQLLQRPRDLERNDLYTAVHIDVEGVLLAQPAARPDSIRGPQRAGCGLRSMWVSGRTNGPKMCAVKLHRPEGPLSARSTSIRRTTRSSLTADDQPIRAYTLGVVP